MGRVTQSLRVRVTYHVSYVCFAQKEGVKGKVIVSSFVGSKDALPFQTDRDLRFSFKIIPSDILRKSFPFYGV